MMRESDIVRAKADELIDQTKGDVALARRMLTEACLADAELLTELVTPYLPGLAAKAVEDAAARRRTRQGRRDRPSPIQGKTLDDLIGAFAARFEGEPTGRPTDPDDLPEPRRRPELPPVPRAPLVNVPRPELPAPPRPPIATIGGRSLLPPGGGPGEDTILPAAPRASPASRHADALRRIAQAQQNRRPAGDKADDKGH